MLDRGYPSRWLVSLLKYQRTKALSAGATATGEPEDHGFMYAHGFEDLDGNTWQLNYMSSLPS